MAAAVVIIVIVCALQDTISDWEGAGEMLPGHSSCICSVSHTVTPSLGTVSELPQTQLLVISPAGKWQVLVDSSLAVAQFAPPFNEI